MAKIHAQRKRKKLTPKDIPENMQEEKIRGVLNTFASAMQLIGRNCPVEQETYMSRMKILTLDDGTKNRIAETLAGIHSSLRPSSRK